VARRAAIRPEGQKERSRPRLGLGGLQGFLVATTWSKRGLTVTRIVVLIEDGGWLVRWVLIVTQDRGGCGPEAESRSGHSGASLGSAADPLIP
jgi:hypothetical protein